MQMRRPLGVGETMDAAFRLYRAAHLPVIALSALFVIPFSTSLLFLEGARVGELLTSPLLQAAGVLVSPLETGSVTSLAAVLGAVTLVLGPIVYCALVRLADQVWRGERPAVLPALIWSVRRFFALVVTAFLVVVAAGFSTVVVLMMVSMGAGVILALIGISQPSEAIGIWIGLGIGVMMLVLMQAVFISYLYVPQVIVVESRGYFRAIFRSFTMVWAHIFRSLGLFTAAEALAVALYLVVLLPELLWQMAVGTTGSGVISAIAEGLVLLLVFPLLPLITTAGYHDLRLRLDGEDLQAKLERLEGGAHG